MLVRVTVLPDRVCSSRASRSSNTKNNGRLGQSFAYKPLRQTFLEPIDGATARNRPLSITNLCGATAQWSNHVGSVHGLCWPGGNLRPRGRKMEGKPPLCARGALTRPFWVSLSVCKTSRLQDLEISISGASQQNAWAGSSRAPARPMISAGRDSRRACYSRRCCCCCCCCCSLWWWRVVSSLKCVIARRESHFIARSLARPLASKERYHSVILHKKTLRKSKERRRSGAD